MTIIVKDNHPSLATLRAEGLDISALSEVKNERPLRIAVVNIMGDPAAAEEDIERAFGESGYDGGIQFDAFSPDSRLEQARFKAGIGAPANNGNGLQASWARAKHRADFHKSFSDLKETLSDYDGVILSGFPKEDKDLVQKSDANPNGVEFYDELIDLLDTVRDDGIATLATCWSAHVALKHFHDIERSEVNPNTPKLTGVFTVKVNHDQSRITTGLDQTVDLPVSRFGASDEAAIQANPNLISLLQGDEDTVGAAVLKEANGNFFYMTGHLEYGAETLAAEYARDLNELGDAAYKPANYDHENPARTWESAAQIFYGNLITIFKERYDAREQQSVSRPTVNADQPLASAPTFDLNLGASGC